MSSYLAFSNPFAAPLHRLGLELMFLGCVALTVRDVVVERRRGNRFAAFEWLVAFFYGIAIELIAYNFLDNYQHARFTLQLYHQKLPFYVVCLYPVFMYTGMRLVQRWRLPAWKEALLAGLAICLIDMPFDVTGVAIGWWSWSDQDPNLAVRWLGVPVTSYYWYLLFGAIYSLICRFSRTKLERRALGLQAALAAPAGLLLIVIGFLSFLPFHGLKALGVRDDFVVLFHLIGCAALLLSTVPRALGRSPGALAWVPLGLGGWHLALLLGVVHPGPRALAFALLALAGALRLAFPLPWLGAPSLKEVP
jgi:hypothetical protein